MMEVGPVLNLKWRQNSTTKAQTANLSTAAYLLALKIQELRILLNTKNEENFKACVFSSRHWFCFHGHDVHVMLFCEPWHDTTQLVTQSGSSWLSWLSWLFHTFSTLAENRISEGEPREWRFESVWTLALTETGKLSPACACTRQLQLASTEASTVHTWEFRHLSLYHTDVGPSLWMLTCTEQGGALPNRAAARKYKKRK